MSSPESEGQSDGLAAATNAPPELEAARAEASARLSRGLKFAAIGSLLAGLASFAVGEMVYEIIPPQETSQREGRGGRDGRPSVEAAIVSAAKNAALAFGALGILLGGALGIAGGLARSSTPGAVTGGVLGVVLGALLGGGVSRAVLPKMIPWQLDNTEQELLIALLMHGLIWGLLGAAAGLAFAVGLGERRQLGRSITAGLVGAVLGAVAFELLGAVFFTSAKTSFPISETWATRALARMLVALGIAATLVLFLRASSRVATGRPAPQAASAPTS